MTSPPTDRADGRSRDRSAGRRRRRPRPPAAAVTEVNLLRHLPGDSPVHRLWAGTKIGSMIAVGIAISLRPTWWGELIVVGMFLLGWALVRAPLGAFPRFPRWFWIGVAITSLTSLVAGGKPKVHIGGLTIGLGGLDNWGKLTLLVLILLALTALLGWTTRLGEVAPALGTLTRPLRWMRLPVDEMIVVVALSVRCLPLLVDEIRTLHAARRLRGVPFPETVREALSAVHDLIVTALVSSVRRGHEMAEAIVARGGMGTTTASTPVISRREVTAWVLVAGVVAGDVVV